VGATVSPYKLKNAVTTVITPVGENITQSLFNSRKTVVPTIVNTDDAKIVFKGNTYNLKAGTHTILDIELVEGENQVIVTSTGHVKFTYQEGDL
jgi:hypothetical protein